MQLLLSLSGFMAFINWETFVIRFCKLFMSSVELFFVWQKMICFLLFKVLEHDKGIIENICQWHMQVIDYGC